MSQARHRVTLPTATTSAPRSTSFASLLPRLAIGAAFVFIGYTKFDGDPRGAWYQIFEQIGLGQWFRVFTGVVQTVGGLLMMVRRTVTMRLSG